MQAAIPASHHDSMVSCYQFCTLASLPCFQDFLQSIFHAMLCAFAIVERSMGGIVHVCLLVEYNSMILRVERQKILIVV